LSRGLLTSLLLQTAGLEAERLAGWLGLADRPVDGEERAALRNVLGPDAAAVLGDDVGESPSAHQPTLGVGPNAFCGHE